MEGQNFNQEYLTRLRAGDEETQRHFTSYFSDHLRIKLRCRLRSSQLIDDVKQETFFRVLKRLQEPNSIEHPERLGAFVNSVCNNVLLESFRGQLKYQGSGFELPEQADPNWDPDAGFVTETRKEQIRAMLEEMPEKERRLLQSMFLEDRDKDDICRDFGVDRQYLRVLLHRAKTRARDIFENKLGVDKAGAGL